MTTKTEWRTKIEGEIDRRWELRKRFEDDDLPAAELEKRRQLAIDHYADDLGKWVNDWVWTYDPRNQGKDIPVYLPFLLVPKQEDLLDWRQRMRAEERNAQIPKSRATGVSYLACAHHLHCWLFEGGFAGKLLGEKEGQVDKRSDPDSLFQKLRIILQYLPKWMKPNGWKGLNSEHDNHRRLINPNNGSTIVGNIGRKPGRGGRGSMADIDEAAHIQNLTEARRAMYNNCECVFEISTYNGTAEPFYQKCKAGDDEVFKIIWSDMPFYDQEWFESKKRDYEDAGDLVGFAQEVKADPEASVENVVCPGAWVEAAVNWEPPKEVARGKRIGSLDVASGGDNSNVYVLRHGALVIDVADSDEPSTTRTAHDVRGRGESDGIDVLHYDAVGVGTGVGDTLGEMPNGPDFQVQPFVASESPSDYEWPNGKASNDRFVNIRAECWWFLRVRIKKTYELVTGEREHDPMDCLSLPNHDELTGQMKQPRFFENRSGLTQIESKDDMEDRGIDSPDHADALMQTFAPIDQDQGWCMSI